MSGASESGTADRANSPSASSGNVDGPEPQQPGPSSGGDGKAPAPSDKTISCVSCRKRKLKCDRVKPKCGTCTRLRHECEYPERKRNLGSKRRNLKELEARLAQVETQLVSESKSKSKSGASAQISPAPNYIETDWNALGMDMNLGMGDTNFLDTNFDVSQAGADFQTTGPTLPVGDFFSQELLALGLREPLPPQDMIDELNEIYFDKIHPIQPIIHKFRYYTSLDRAPHMRPPICLRYAMWAMAASISDKYLPYEDILYERARTYIHEAEMKGHGEAFVSVYNGQAWILIATFEAKKTYFSRAWMSTGRATRLVHMLGLHRLDGDGSDIKAILQPPTDFIELEERRRTFWGAFYGDRWASSSTGWPMTIDEKEIMTNLPSSEEAFETGVIQHTISLEEALTPEGAAKVSPYGGVVLSAALFGHNFDHLHRTGPNERPDDLANGEFWKRHRKMDNVLSNTFMFLPDHLRLPNALRDMNVVFLHMNVHASAICLHQAAILTLERHHLDPAVIRQSRARSLMAAEEIVTIMRLVSHIDASNMNSWMGFTLYVAGGIFIQDAKSDESQPQSQSNLEFLLAAMQAIGKRHSITHHFTAQLELDIEAAGLWKCSSFPYFHKKDSLPCGTGNGLLAERQGVSMTLDNNCSISEISAPPGFQQQDGSNAVGKHNLVPLYGIMPATSRSASPRNSPSSTTSGPVPDWISHPQGAINRTQSTATNLKTRSFITGASSAFTPASFTSAVQSESTFGEVTAFCPFDQGGTANIAGTTPSSDTSSSNTVQYPHRPSDPSSRAPASYGLFPYEENMDPNMNPAHNQWQATEGQTAFDNPIQAGHNLNAYLQDQIWNRGSGQGAG